MSSGLPRRLGFMTVLAVPTVGSAGVGVASGPTGVDDLVERHRRPLTGYCYRMLGSAFDAEDAVQETLVRAWQRSGELRDAGAERAWLYRIATNVCLDMLRSAKRRALPRDLSAHISHPVSPGDILPDTHLVGPIPDVFVVADDGDPAEIATQRESIRLAFVAALQLLPSGQRAVLILRDVLCWRAAEVAELLDISVVAVNSALQRGRDTLGAAADRHTAPTATGEPNALADRYAAAFERFDLDALVSLLHLDATLCMSPYSSWLRGADEVRAWYAGAGSGCRGSRLCQVTANGAPAFAQYRPGGHAWALHVIDVGDGRSRRSTRSWTPIGCFRFSGCRRGARSWAVSPVEAQTPSRNGKRLTAA